MSQRRHWPSGWIRHAEGVACLPAQLGVSCGLQTQDRLAGIEKGSKTVPEPVEDLPAPRQVLLDMADAAKSSPKAAVLSLAQWGP